MDIETTPVPSKRQKFTDLANARVNAALKAIALIGNLSNKSTYDFSKDEVAQIFKALNDAVATVRQRFEGTKPEASQFRLK
jgi:methyl-accepting chemotaxis protein